MKKIAEVLKEEEELKSSLKRDLIKVCQLYDRMTKDLSRSREQNSILQYRIAKRKLNIYASYLSGFKNLDRLSLLFASFDKKQEEDDNA